MTGQRVRLNDEAVGKARSLIGAGSVDRESWFRLSSEDVLAMLGDPPAWDRVGAYHLGVAVGVDRGTIEAYRYPIGRGDTLFRSALLAAMVEATQGGHPGVCQAAAELLQAMDASTGGRVALSTYGISLMAMGELASPADVAYPWPEWQWIHVLPWGQAKTNDGRPLVVNEESVRSITAQLEKRSADVVVDYDHATLEPGKAAPAAGWMSRFEWRLPEAGEAPTLEHGLWAYAWWTRQARADLEERRYRYLSPAVVQGPQGVALRLFNAALVCQPAIDNLFPVAASEAAAVHVNTAQGAPHQPQSHEEEDTDVDMQKLLAALGYKSPEDAIAGVQDLTAKLAGITAQLTTAETSLTAMREKVTAAEEAVARTASELNELKVKATLAEARKAGTVNDRNAAFAERLARTSPEMFEEFVKIPAPTNTGRLPVTPSTTQGSEQDPIPFTQDADPERVELHQRVLEHQAANKCSYGEAYEAVSRQARK